MAKFCGSCGSPLNDAAVFCGGCGARVPAPAAAQPQVVATPAYSPVAPYVPGPVGITAAAKKSSTLLKVLVACGILLFVGGALAIGGIWYAAHRISQKARLVAAQSPELASVAGAVSGLMGSAASEHDNGDSGFKGDPCRFLSKEEVSRAVGLTVIREDAQDGSCSYIAKGDPADVTAKHVASMLGGLGADANSQKTVQKLAGSLFAQQEAEDKSLSAEAAKGEIPVLVVIITSGNAQAEMKLNRSGFNYVNGGGSESKTGTGDLDGIGDEA